MKFSHLLSRLWHHITGPQAVDYNAQDEVLRQARALLATSEDDTGTDAAQDTNDTYVLPLATGYTARSRESSRTILRLLHETTIIPGEQDLDHAHAQQEVPPQPAETYTLYNLILRRTEQKIIRSGYRDTPADFYARDLIQEAIQKLTLTEPEASLEVLMDDGPALLTQLSAYIEDFITHDTKTPASASKFIVSPRGNGNDGPRRA